MNEKELQFANSELEKCQANACASNTQMESEMPYALWARHYGFNLIAALREARADTEAVKHQMEVAGNLSYKAEKENLAEIARLERLVMQRDEEAAEQKEAHNLATLDLICGTMERNENGCGCRRCNPNAGWLVACDTCGNKRCPHATNHALGCTNSNKPGQAGSVFE